MKNSFVKTRGSQVIVSIWRTGLIALCGVIVLATAQAAFIATFDSADFPDALAIKLDLLPLVFPLHMFTGGLALLLVPLAIYLRHTRWHPWVGRAAAADILLAATTAIPVALAYPITPWAAAGFSAQALFWIVFLGLGIHYVRRGRIAAHQHMMLLMAAVTSGAFFFRIFLYVWKEIGSAIPFHTFYSLNAWLAWALPVIGIQAFLLHRNSWKPAIA
jgi:Predicted membrane protein (DUF2306)